MHKPYEKQSDTNCHEKGFRMNLQHPHPDSDYCHLQTSSTFQKGEVILSINDHTGRIGILRSGEAHLCSMDPHGAETVLEVFTTGDSFGEHFLQPLEHEALFVIADSRCEIVFFNLSKILTGCSMNCEYHEEMLKALLLLCTRHAQNETIHLNILSKRSLREKIMTYLQYQEEFSGESEFTIPMTLVSLASYLCADRSSMMREIAHMNRDGLIESNGRSFKLLL